MKRVLLALALMISPAFAADIPTKAPPQQPVTVDVMTWTGPYAGVSLGYISKDESTGINGNNSFSQSLINNGTVPGSVNVRPNGLALGGVLGYDYQFNQRFILGVAVDWSYTDAYATGTAIGNLVNRTVNERISNLGTIRARLGYLVDPRMLVYVTGGGAWARIKSDVSSAGPVCGGNISCASGSNSDTRWGWALGGGVEYALTSRWHLGLEAIYAKLGTYNTTINGSVNGQPVSYNLSQDANIGIVRTSLTGRF